MYIHGFKLFHFCLEGRFICLGLAFRSAAFLFCQVERGTLGMPPEPLNEKKPSKKHHDQAIIFFMHMRLPGFPARKHECTVGYLDESV